jgi:hypothetical protein
VFGLETNRQTKRQTNTLTAAKVLRSVQSIDGARLGVSQEQAEAWSQRSPPAAGAVALPVSIEL